MGGQISRDHASKTTNTDETRSRDYAQGREQKHTRGDSGKKSIERVSLGAPRETSSNGGVAGGEFGARGQKDDVELTETSTEIKTEVKEFEEYS